MRENRLAMAGEHGKRKWPQPMSRKQSISLDLRWIEYFVAVADAGSISGAAFRLGISQPSASETRAILESQLDEALLLRDVRGAALTEAGAALANHSREILKGIDVALEEPRYLGGDARGQVTVDLSHGIGHLLSVALAETASIELPSVKLRISEGASEDLLEWLASGQVDFAVLDHGHACGNVEAHALFEEDLFVVSAPNNWPPPGETIVPWQAIELDLKGVPLVLPSPQQNFGECVEREARSSLISPLK
jgi:LysR family transcriptional regulator, nitrogen assimilation regulatory protein